MLKPLVFLILPITVAFANVKQGARSNSKNCFTGPFNKARTFYLPDTITGRVGWR